MLTRRNFFGFLSALGAAAVPVAAKSESAASPVQPIILEHTCDWGKAFYTAEEIRESESYSVEHLGTPRYWGCGTVFQWHFGMNPICPKCGYCYLGDLGTVKRGVYRVVQGRIPE